uniref:Uncharacterized protein n=1 Tax=Amphimedon queenslandica TaxID=400682 RepID=A0A1X7U672_AMPQE
MSYAVLEAFDVLRSAVSAILKDKGFTLPSEKAQRAKLCSERLLEWMEDNKQASEDFSFKLIVSLKSCCHHSRKVKPRTHRQRMWKNYYKYCCSNDLKSAWDTFLKASIGFNACPVFFLFVTKVTMNEVIKKYFFIPNGECFQQEVASLGYEEVNALRYSSGYVIHSLLKKVKRSNHPKKEELILCLQELKEKEGIESK